MIKIIDFLKKQTDLCSIKGVDKKQIEDAEKSLGLQFADDYKLCLSTFGVFSFAQYEICGLGSSDRLSVVKQTLSKRSLINLKQELYVIENESFDDIVCCQDYSGKIFAVSSQGKTTKVANSLLEFLSLEPTKK